MVHNQSLFFILCHIILRIINNYITVIIMPRCAYAQARYTVVCVCLSVCVDCYSCSRMNQVQVRVSIGF